MNMDVQISVHIPDFNSFGYITRGRFTGSYSSSMFNFLRSFPQWLYHFTFPPTVHKGSNLSTSSPTLVIFVSCDNSYPKGCEVLSHRGF